MSEPIVIKTIQEWGGSYDDIHEVLYEAHRHNRQRGLVYKSTLLNGAELQRKVGDGITYVALIEGRPVGTGSAYFCTGRNWYDKGVLVAHYCLAGVLPEYQGKGIMSQLYSAIEQYAITRGAKIVRSGTAERNAIQRSFFKRYGFIPVDFLISKGNDYFSVMYAKWLDPSVAHSYFKCKLHMIRSACKMRLLYTSTGKKSFVGKVLRKGR